MDPRGVRRAARLADAWYPVLRPLDEMERALAYYRECLKEFGRPMPPEFPIRLEVYIARDHATAIEEGSRYLQEPLRSRMGSPVNPDVFFGRVAGVAGRAHRKVQGATGGTSPRISR